MRSQRRTVSEARRASQRAKRERLLGAAIEVVRRQGPGVSMDEIARAAGVTKPIIYRAFGDREGLTNAVAARFTEELSGALGEALSNAPDDRTRVTRTIDTYLSFIEREPEIVRFLIHRGLERSEDSAVALSGFVAGVGQMITQAIGEAMRARGLDSGAAEPWAYAIVGAVHLAGDWWLDRRVMSRERLVEYLTALVWDGMQSYVAIANNVMPLGKDPMDRKGRTG